MAKRPKPGKCVHCLRDPVDRNWDHVFPKSWYPDTTPPNLYKWQIPSCVGCNRELGVVEVEFFVRMALGLDPKAPASKSIVAKARRAMNPEEAKNAADRRARSALAKRINTELLHGAQIPRVGTYPNLGERWGRPAEWQIAIVIPESSFHRITEKIVRGITYLEGEQFIELPHRVHFFALDDAGAEPARQLLDAAGQVFAREPGVIVRRAVTPDDGVSAIYEVEFWGQFKTHAAVLDGNP